MIRVDGWRGTRLYCPDCGYDKRFSTVLATMETFKYRCRCKRAEGNDGGDITERR